MGTTNWEYLYFKILLQFLAWFWSEPKCVCNGNAGNKFVVYACLYFARNNMLRRKDGTLRIEIYFPLKKIFLMVGSWCFVQNSDSSIDPTMIVFITVYIHYFIAQIVTEGLGSHSTSLNRTELRYGLNEMSNILLHPNGNQPKI